MTDFIDIGVLGVVSNMPQYISLNSFYSQLVSTGKLGASEQVVVTGHSLGGFLAQAFTANHSSVVSAAYTYNAPGFAGVNALLGFLNVLDTSASSKITNVHAADGLSFTAGLGTLLGVSVPVRIEQDTVNPLSNHSVVRLGDSLAVQAVLAALDPVAAIGSTNTLVQAGSNRMDNTLESVLDAVRRLVMDPSTSATGTGDRNALYANLKTLTDSAAFKAIAGKVSLSTSSAVLATTARIDFTSLLSLLTLSPVALKATAGNEVAVESALKTAWNTAYTAWAADKAMTQADRDAGKTNYTQIYLDDRAAMASWLVYRNTRDNEQLTISNANAGEQVFQDVGSSTTIRMGSALTGDSSRRQFLFGGDSVDSLTGGNINDHVYGGAGNDSLNGQGGADYLEGNAGADTLDGGTGTFNDVLNGGADADLYIVGTKAGFDTIASSDAGDRLQLGGRVLNGSGTFFSSAGGVTEWRDSSVAGDVINYSLDSAAQVLTVTGAHSVVRVKDFVSGDLGISAPVAPAPPPPPATSAFNDFAQVTATPSVAWRDTVTPGVANHLVNFSNWYTGSYANLLGISSQAGNDWIEGGVGTNTNLKLIKAGSGDDQVYASTTQTLADAVAAQDGAVATGRSDLLLDGGFGNDSVFGAAGDDALFGGDGADTIVGGAGSDVIFSDGDSGLQYPELTPQSTTGFRWVAGSNAAGSWIYFNGAPRFGTVAYGYGGSGLPSQEEQHFTGNYYSIESTDFTPLAALGSVPLGAGDYPAGWTVQADGRFYASYTPTGAFDPQAGYYFNTNRYSGSDVVFAGSGGDMVNAGGGNDYIDAGSGDDMVRGYQGDDQIYGGAGSDNLLGDAYATVGLADEKYLGVTYRKFGLDPGVAGQEHGNDYIDGGADNDRIVGNGGADVLLGGSGNDFVFGDDEKTSGGQFIKDEFGGNDYIDTGVGDDFAQGGARNDDIAGGDGADALFGDNHFEDGVPGAGRITAAGDDTLDGGIGNDSIWGEGGNDSILGGDGNDQLVGDGHISDLRSELHGKDDIDGGAGNDLIFGGGDNDVLRGGDGNDWLAGEDQESTGATTTLTGDDVLMGGAGTDTLIGGVGSDQLSGGDNADILYAGTGDDVLDGGAGSDTLLGGDGADTYVFGIGSGNDAIVNSDADALGTQADTVLLGAGVTTENIIVQSTTGATAAGSLVIGIAETSDSLLISDYFLSSGTSKNAVEFIKFSDGKVWTVADVKAKASGSGIAGVARSGTESSDTLSGTTGADRLFGLGGADVLNGGDGNDYFVGGAGNDTLNSTAGNDVYRFDIGDGADTILDSGGDADELRFGPGVVPSDITLVRSGGDMIFKFANGIDQLTVKSWRESGFYQIETISFVDGTAWTADEVNIRSSQIIGTNGPDVLVGTFYSDILLGLAGDDSLTADYYRDTLNGGDGNDTLSHGGAINVTYVGGRGNDTINGYDTSFYIFDAGDGADVITNVNTDAGSYDELHFGAGIASTNITVQRVGTDLVFKRNDSADQITVKQWFTSPDGLNQIDRVFFDDVTWTNTEVTARAQPPIIGTAGNDQLTGTEYAEAIYGMAGNDTLLGAGPIGGDLLYGGDGDDVLKMRSGYSDFESATFSGGRGNDTITGGWYSDIYLFDLGDGADSITESIHSSGADDELRFGAGIAPTDINTLRVGEDLVFPHVNQSDRITFKSWFANGNYQIEKIKFSDALNTVWTSSDIYTRMKLIGTIGTVGDDFIVGTYSVDTLIGAGGNDLLIADGIGDLLDGGPGDDILRGNGGGASGVNFVGGKGNDTLTGSDDIDTYLFNLGDGEDTIIYPNPTFGADDELRFGAGINSSGITVFRSGLDVIFKHANGTDQVTATNWFADDYGAHPIDKVVFSDTTWTAAQIKAAAIVLSTNKDDVLNGTAEADSILGLGGNDVINGLAGNDTLDGGTGVDTLQGGTGDDVYVVDDIADIVTELVSEGRDTARASLTWTLGANVEDLILTGSSAINGTGNALDNVLQGNDAANTLSGLGGNDTMTGGLGNDTYVVDSTGDVVNELSSQGTDAVNASASWTLSANLEKLTLTGTAAINATGNSLANTLIGNAGANRLDGGAGIDSMTGGAGNDTYVVDVAGEVITESASGGIDTVESSVTWTLAAETENLTLTGTANLNGTGNAVANTLIGNAGANRLDGGAGADAMTGGGGNDTYVVDNTGDRTTEVASAGADAVESSISWTLAAEIEKITLTGTAANNATGNASANTLIGNAGINRLDGAAGADAMTGGAGNDTFVVDNVGDTTIETASGGADSVEASISWTLAAEVERLTLTGSTNTNGTGNSLANTLIGNAGNNRLDGAAGADVMTGGAGDDTYVVDNAGDKTIEVAAGGLDAVEASIGWALSAEVEKLTLTGTAANNGTGNGLANTLIGNAGANRLDGATGADAMTGGAGDDTYVVDNVGDTTIEAASGGADAVESSISWTLATEVEKLTLTGTANINGTGNAVANTVIGNAGFNRLDGAAGADAMTGGAGNDTYVVDNVGDTTIEVASGGTDAVESSIGWTLATEVEKLTLTGTGNINGTGNSLANTLIGNAGANVLDGGAGNDSLNGGEGLDTYVGGLGSDTLTDTSTTSNDICVWGRGEGADTLTDAGGTDRLDILAGVTEGQIWLRHVGNNLELSIIGTSDSFTINGWYTSTANRVESFKLSDGQALQASQVQQLVDAMAAFAPPAAGQTTLPANYQTALNPVIAPSWA